MIKQKHRDIEPIEMDCSLKYVCPDCSNTHWISLREAKTKNFKIVCECNTIIVPKKVKKLKVVFCKQKIVKKSKHTVVIPTVPAPKNILNTDIQKKCIDALAVFGYTDNEINKLFPEAIDACSNTHIKLVIDYLLKNLGEKNEQRN